MNSLNAFLGRFSEGIRGVDAFKGLVWGDYQVTLFTNV